MKKNYLDVIKYKFDESMSKGMNGIILLLTVLTVFVVGIFTVLTLIFVRDAEGVGTISWNYLSTIINGWMPEAEENPDFVLVFSGIVAIIGLLFTSILVGLFASAIENKVTELRKGHSHVVETGHFVVMGYVTRTTRIIQELIDSAGKNKLSIVVATAMESDELKDNISENIEIPSNIKIICRTIDIGNPNSLECLSIPTCAGVVISGNKDDEKIKGVLAAYSIIKDCQREIPIIAGINDRKVRKTIDSIGDSRIILVSLDDFASRIIAHSCTQKGVSTVIEEILCFAGSEFYTAKQEGYSGERFSKLISTADRGMPVGLLHNDGSVSVNPDADKLIAADDDIIYFASDSNNIKVNENLPDCTNVPLPIKEHRLHNKVLIIGYNRRLPLIIEELLAKGSKVVIENISSHEESVLRERYANSFEEGNIWIDSSDIGDDDALSSLVADVQHVVLLSNEIIDVDKADIQTIMILLRLRAIKKRSGYDFNITAEVSSEQNSNLIIDDNDAEFIVSDSLTGMFMAQLVVNPKLNPLFKELLSWKGNEIYLIPVNLDKLENAMSGHDLRVKAFEKGCILIGLIEDGEYITDLEVGKNYTPESLIVLAEMLEGRYLFGK